MKHDERMNLAEFISTRMIAKYSSDIVLSGISGSTARGTDTPWSDLELLFVVRGGSKVEARHFLFRGTAVGRVAIEQGALEKQITSPDSGWEYWMGVLSYLKVLHGDPEQVQAWLRMGQSVPAKRFRESLEASLSWLVHEPYGRILSCSERRNTQDVSSAVMELLSDIKLALCLFNQRWITHKTYRGIVDTFSFPKLPEGYREIVPVLWSARNLDEIVPLAETLVRNFWQFLANEGVRSPVDYQRVDDIPL
jgi:kanamycin nucleotidyltransferase